ncbi:hypothetical protein YC2023_023023 [Brassica napus]
MQSNEKLQSEMTKLREMVEDYAKQFPATGFGKEMMRYKDCLTFVGKLDGAAERPFPFTCIYIWTCGPPHTAALFNIHRNLTGRDTIIDVWSVLKYGQHRNLTGRDTIIDMWSVLKYGLRVRRLGVANRIDSIIDVWEKEDSK